MENDLIRRSDLLAKKCLIRGHLDTGSPCPSKVKAVPVDVIEREPAVDAVPVRTGRWVEYENESDIGYHYCSECKHQAFNYDEGGCNVEILSDYCPHCGARMDGCDEDG